MFCGKDVRNYVDSKKVETREKYPLSPSIGSTDIEETLVMMNTMYQEKSGTFLQKSANLQIFAQTDSKKSQKVGEIKLNLVDYMNEPLVQKFFPISGCGDKKAKVSLSIKGRLIGETFTENASDASGGSLNVSEDEKSHYSEHETSLEKNLYKKPPVFKGHTETTAEEKQRITNLAAKVSMLEKENQQIRSEKEDTKLQLKLLIENSQKERQKFCEHSLKLDETIEELKHNNKKLEKKVQKKNEKLKKLQKDLLEAGEELQTLKSKFTESEKVKLLEVVKGKNKENFELREELNGLRDLMEIHENEKDMLENGKNQMQGLNLMYLNEISGYKVKISELQESFVGASESQGPKKKNVEGVLQDMKKELEKMQNERDEVFNKNTDLLVNLQKIKKQHLENEQSLKQKIRKLEFELESKNNENIELNERLTEEINKIQVFARKTITEKEEISDQITKINKNYKEALQTNDLLSRTLKDTERKFSRNRSETDPTTTEKLQRTIQTYQNDLSRVKQDLASANQENKELKSKVQHFQLEFENFPDTKEGSPDTQALNQKLENSVKFFSLEKKGLQEKNFLLKEENSVLQEKLKDLQKDFENQIMSLKVQLISLEENQSNVKNSGDFVSGLKEESYKQTVEMKKLEIKELKGLVLKVQEELKNSERKYMDLKVSLANFDLEKETVSLKYREIQDQLLEYSNNCTTMEIEFFKTNEKLAKCLNENIDLVNEIDYLKMQIFQLQNRRRRKNK